MNRVKLTLILPPARGVTWAVGVRDIPRNCDTDLCAWTEDRTRKPAVYELTAAHPSCPFHGVSGPRKPVLTRTAS
jgi:hypothetical protein